MQKSALINIMLAACCDGARQLIRDFNELAFLKANRRLEDFVETTRQRTTATIQEQLMKSNPGHGIMLDSQIIKPSETGLCWAINPIDSMSNFMHRLPFFGSCIALLDQSTEIKNPANYNVLAATFYDPMRDETFWAEKNAGTFMNSKKLMLISTNNAQRMKLQKEQNEFTMPTLIAGMHKNANRNFGSSAMHMAYVAANRIDATYEKIDEKINDIANICTGKLFVQEAKGVVTCTNDLICAMKSTVLA